MTLITHPLFTVHIVWHPSFKSGLQIAEHIRIHFERDTYITTGEDSDVSVLYHSEPSSGASVPHPVDWSKTGFTVAVVLMESALYSDPAWCKYIENMRKDSQAGRTIRGFFPVIVEKFKTGFKLNKQGIPWYCWDMPEEERCLRLTSELTYGFCRIIRNHLEESRLGGRLSIGRRLEKIQVFISHSKHDWNGEHGRNGEAVANGIRDWLHKNSQLSSFMDVHDIPPGEPFEDVLEDKLDAGAFIAIHTDSYSSREWCRREVIEAKLRMVPMIVADCVQELDPRGIPYLGNVPMVRMEPDQKDQVATVIGYLLDETFRTWLWRYRVEPHQAKFPGVRFIARPPELITLATLPDGRYQGETALVYPEPLLGADEQRLFSKIAPCVNIQTLAQWLEEHQMIEHKKQPLPVVAVSISESPNMGEFGLSDGHLRSAMEKVALHLLASGFSLAYGGDLRQSGFMQLLFDLIGRYRDHPQHNGTVSVTDYLAWPVHISMNADDLVPYSDSYAVGAEFVFLSRTGYRLGQREQLELPMRKPDKAEWAEGLTAMRTVMCKETQARIALGGRVDGYKGVMPGIAEEVCLSLEACQPTFLIGGFGGCARDIAETIGLADRRAGSHRDWPGRSRLCRYSAEDLRNGLSREENMVLAQTPYIGKAIGLITHGLHNVLYQGRNDAH